MSQNADRSTCLVPVGPWCLPLAQTGARSWDDRGIGITPRVRPHHKQMVSQIVTNISVPICTQLTSSFNHKEPTGLWRSLPHKAFYPPQPMPWWSQQKKRVWTSKHSIVFTSSLSWFVIHFHKVAEDYESSAPPRLFSIDDLLKAWFQDLTWSSDEWPICSWKGLKYIEMPRRRCIDSNWFVDSPFLS